MSSVNGLLTPNNFKLYAERLETETLRTDELLIGAFQGLKGSTLVSDGSSYKQVPVGADDQILVADSTLPEGVRWANTTPGSGDVDGPAGAVDDNITVFDGATGKIIKDSGISVTSLTPVPWQDGADAVNFVRVGSAASTNANEQVALLGTATALNAVSIGPFCSSTSPFAVSMGTNADATNTAACAIGSQAQASGTNSCAFGPSSNAAGTDGLAVGTGSIANASNSVAIGDATSLNDNGVAIGNDATVSAINAISMGHLSTASGDNSVAVGGGPLAGAQADNEGAVAVGAYAKALGGKVAIGYGNASGAGSVAVGGLNQVVLSEASGANSVAMGVATASNDRAISMGYLSNAIGLDSIGVGSNVNVRGDNAIAVGKDAQTGVGFDNAMAFGAGAQANNTNTIALGKDSLAAGVGSIMIGQKKTTAPAGTYTAGNAIYIGNNIEATASNAAAVIIGYNAKHTAGTAAVIIGEEASVSGIYAVSVGRSSTCSGNGGVALGYLASVPSTLGNGSIAVGQQASSNSIGTIAVGRQSSATGANSMAVGYFANASHPNSISLGYLATSHPDHRFSIGNQGVTATPGTPSVLADWFNVRVNNINKFIPMFSSAGTLGDVKGPGTSVNNRLAIFNGATGKFIKDSDGSPFTIGTGGAAGDILVRTATGYERKAVGTNGQYLIVAGGVPTWATIPSFIPSYVEMYQNNNAGATVIAATGTYVKVNLTASVAGEKTADWTVDANNRMTYTGALTRVYKLDSTVGGVTGNNDYVGAMFYKNGVALPKTTSYGAWDNLGDRSLASTQGLVSMATGDYLELWMANLDATDSITVNQVNIQAIAVNQ